MAIVLNGYKTRNYQVHSLYGLERREVCPGHQLTKLQNAVQCVKPDWVPVAAQWRRRFRRLTVASSSETGLRVPGPWMNRRKRLAHGGVDRCSEDSELCA